MARSAVDAFLIGADGVTIIDEDNGVPVSVTTGGGKTLLFAVINQGGAGTTSLVSAVASQKIKVVSYAFTLDTQGTAKFTGTGDLTGTFDVAQYGGVACAGSTDSHLLETSSGAALSIVTTGGGASGHLSYFTEA